MGCFNKKKSILLSIPILGCSNVGKTIIFKYLISYFDALSSGFALESDATNFHEFSLDYRKNVKYIETCGCTDSYLPKITKSMFKKLYSNAGSVSEDEVKKMQNSLYGPASKGNSFSIIDVGGSIDFRSNFWENLFRASHGFVYVFGVTSYKDYEMVDIETQLKIFQKDALRHLDRSTPLLVLFNEIVPYEKANTTADDNNSDVNFVPNLAQEQISYINDAISHLPNTIIESKCDGDSYVIGICKLISEITENKMQIVSEIEKRKRFSTEEKRAKLEQIRLKNQKLTPIDIDTPNRTAITKSLSTNTGDTENKGQQSLRRNMSKEDLVLFSAVADEKKTFLDELGVSPTLGAGQKRADSLLERSTTLLQKLKTVVSPCSSTENDHQQNNQEQQQEEQEQRSLSCSSLQTPRETIPSPSNDAGEMMYDPFNIVKTATAPTDKPNLSRSAIADKSEDRTNNIQKLLSPNAHLIQSPSSGLRNTYIDFGKIEIIPDTRKDVKINCDDSADDESIFMCVSKSVMPVQDTADIIDNNTVTSSAERERRKAPSGSISPVKGEVYIDFTEL